MGPSQIGERAGNFESWIIQHSLRLAQIAASLGAENAFTEVLGEIETMIELIVDEGKADAEKRSWCRSEREANDKSLGEKNGQIIELKTTTTKLTNTIEEPGQCRPLTAHSIRRMRQLLPLHQLMVLVAWRETTALLQLATMPEARPLVASSLFFGAA